MLTKLSSSIMSGALKLGLLIVFCFAGFGFAGSCGGQSGSSNESEQARVHRRLDEMATASNELAHDVDVVISVVGTLYANNKLPLATKDKIAGSLVIVSRQGGLFNQKLQQYAALERAGQPVPGDALSLLADNWRQIWQAFLDVKGLIQQEHGQNKQQLASATKSLAQHVAVIRSVLKEGGVQ